MIFYQALAWRRLGDEARADAIFQRLIAYGHDHGDEQVRTDYFAVSLPSFLVFNDDPTLRNTIHCHYMRALGLLGLKHPDAITTFDALLAHDAHHQGARFHRTFRHLE